MTKSYAESTGGFYDSAIHSPEQIPSDAVEITDEQHAVLLDGQSQGKVIASDTKGKPVLKDPPAPTSDELASSARSKRDGLIDATDYYTMPDYPSVAATLALVKTYRQALRDVTKQAGFPATITWPVCPI